LAVSLGEVAVLVEVVVAGGVDGAEFLQAFHLPEPYEGVFVVEPLRLLPAVLDGVSPSGSYAVEGGLAFTGIALAVP